jgi:SOS-response transcriptional repressor LexA
MLHRLMKAEGERTSGEAEARTTGSKKASSVAAASAATASVTSAARAGASASSASAVIDLDDAFMSGVLQEMVERSAGNIESVSANAVPVINRVSAGYPRDFTDLSYPRGIADEYVTCPDLHDRDAFAARVYGDSMIPKYRESDIVIFSPAAVPREGDDCFVRFKDGQTTFKRVFFEAGENGTSMLRLQPRNERYRAQVVPSTNVTGLYRAVYRYQRVDED